MAGRISPKRTNEKGYGSTKEISVPLVVAVGRSI